MEVARSPEWDTPFESDMYRANERLQWLKKVLPQFRFNIKQVFSQLTKVPREHVWKVIDIVAHNGAQAWKLFRKSWRQCNHWDEIQFAKPKSGWEPALQIFIGFSSAVASMRDWECWRRFFQELDRRQICSPPLIRFALGKSILFLQRDVFAAVRLLCRLAVMDCQRYVVDEILDELANLVPFAHKQKLARMWNKYVAENSMFQVQQKFQFAYRTTSPWKIHWKRRKEKRTRCACLLINHGLLPADVVHHVLLSYM